MAGRDFFTLVSCRNRDELSPQPSGKGGHAGTQTKPGAAPRSPITYLSTFPMGRQAEKATGMEERRTHPAREIPSSHKSCRISA